MKVKELIKILSRYPPSMEVSFYRPGLPTSYRILGVSQHSKLWISNSKRLYIPTGTLNTDAVPMKTKGVKK